jgi:hypothetical protein
VDTAARPISAEPAFHANDFEEAPEYSSVSALAIISVLFGLASPLCLVSRFFLIIPILGAAISLLALVRIAGSGGALAGRAAALFGLAVCVAFGVAELSRGAITRYLRTSEAEKVAREWLEVLTSGDVQRAFRLTVDGQRPPPSGTALDPKPPVDPLVEFSNSELIKQISSAGKDAEIDLTSTEDYQRLTWRQFIVRQRFQITPAGPSANGKGEPFDIDVTTQRSRFERNETTRWLVWKFEKPTDGDS